MLGVRVERTLLSEMRLRALPCCGGRNEAGDLIGRVVF